MTSRYHVEIDGRVLVDHANLWLPPTTSFIAELEPGEHDVRILAGAKDAPILQPRGACVALPSLRPSIMW
jgi:alpha-D-xyloside xylohydrolase